MSPVGRIHLLSAIALLAAAAAGALLPAALGKTVVVPTAVRSALAQTSQVQGASGRTMVLSRVVIEPEGEIALHRHLGTQVARVQSGVLRYTVQHGSVVVRRGESDQDPEVVRTIHAGQTGRIQAGEWIVEQPSVVHRAANPRQTPTVIYIATLLEKGAPPSTPVSSPSSR